MLGKASSLNRRLFMRYGALAFSSGLMSACFTEAPKKAPSNLDKINIGLSWVAQAEYCGYYQAVATDIYKEYGLDVTVKPGGPRMNVGLLLMIGGTDLALGDGTEALKAVESTVPKVTVASIFQKAPRVLISHPNVGINSLEDLRGKPILTSSSAGATYWPFLKEKYGYTDDQQQPYQFDVEPFLNDPNLSQQGLLTSEPFEISQRGQFEPVVMLLADEGYDPYSFTIETTSSLVETNPDLVQRFVDASIKGWYSYLEDPSPGNALIKRDNPDMSDALLSYSLKSMKDYGIIVSGDAEELGIGAMTDERWQQHFQDMVGSELINPNTDYKKAYTLQFINKGKRYYAG